MAAGTTVEQRFVLRSAPGAAQAKVTFSFVGGHPSDGSQAIATSGSGASSMTPPKTTTVKSGSDAIVTMKLKVPVGARAGIRTGTVLVNVAGVTGVDGTPGGGSAPDPGLQPIGIRSGARLSEGGRPRRVLLGKDVGPGRHGQRATPLRSSRAAAPPGTD